MAFLKLLSDEPHDGGAGVDDQIPLPRGEEVRPAASHVKPLERLQRLYRARRKVQIKKQMHGLPDTAPRRLSAAPLPS
jgi:hypothetical protein